jgi:6,7-dimethyl-8-ribityllumazine synthase
VKSGSPAHQPVAAAGLRVAVAWAAFNEDVTGGLRDGAVAWLEASGATVRVVEVPGAFELPLVAQHLAASHDAVVALGAVIEGDTDHYEHVAHRTSEGLMRVMLDTGTPVAFGVLTVRTPEHALKRSLPGPGNKGAEAAAAAVRTALLLRELRPG